MTGIVSYGFYAPIFRIKVASIASFWGKNPQDIEKSLGVAEKSVPQVDEDAVTLAIESSIEALNRSGLDTSQIKAVVVGSESHPYAVKPTSTTVAQILGIKEDYLALDTQFACKAATGGMQLLLGLVEAGRTEYGLVIGSDAAQAKPNDALEFTASCASASFILGKDKLIAKILGFTSISSNTPDFWRRDGQKYPSHAGRFTGEPAYFSHVLAASSKLLEQLKLKPTNFAHAVFHMPNGKFPQEAAKKLGFSQEQLQAGFLVKTLGNPYCASALSGLASILDIAKPGQKIFACSYGSGAGSDAFVFQVTSNILAYQKSQKSSVHQKLANKKYIDYPEILKRLVTNDYL